MELQHLRIFYEVAQRGSVSAAAGALRVTQPSVSRGVQKLENSLNLNLFTRHPRGVTLTDDGRRIFERCHRIFQECEFIQKGSAGPSHKLKIAASENLCIHVFPQVLAQSRTGVDIDLLSGGAEEVIKAVLTGQVDIGYCYHPSKVAGLRSTAVAAVEFWLVVRGKKSTKSMTAKDLRGQSFVGSFSKQYQGPYAAKALLAEAGIAVETEHQCSSQEAQVAMVMAGLGYSLVPWFIVKEKIDRGHLCKVSLRKTLRTPLFRIMRVDGVAPVSDDFEEGLRAAVEC